jgi:hypothetical protein
MEDNLKKNKKYMYLTNCTGSTYFQATRPTKQTKVMAQFKRKSTLIGCDVIVNWSEQSACAALDCWQKRRWPLIYVFYCFFFFLLFFGVLLFKTPEGVVVVGFLNCAWAPN